MENEDLVYFVGIADESYDHLAERCRRHVLFLKNLRSFVLIDEYVGRRGISVSYQWNIHSWHDITCVEKDRSFVIANVESDSRLPKLHGTVLYGRNCFWAETEGWDPPPKPGVSEDEYRNQFHLRFSTADLVERLTLPVVIRPEWEGNPPPEIEVRRDDEAETVVFPDAAVSAYHSAPFVARIQIGGHRYTITQDGMEA
jgi:hypothetical protein